MGDEGYSREPFIGTQTYMHMCMVMGLTLSLQRVINFNFLFQSFTRDISYSMENLAIDSLLRLKLVEQSFSLHHSIIFLLEWLGEIICIMSLGLKGLNPS